MNLLEAKSLHLPGWNLRCNFCGEHPAKWIGNERPGWGSLCLCDKHAKELSVEKERHEKEMRRLRTINFEQLSEFDVNSQIKTKPLYPPRWGMARF